MNRSTRITGIALVLFAFFYLAGFLLASPISGLQDGDNPASSLAFITQSGDLYFLSGLAYALAGGVLVLATHSASDSLAAPTRSPFTKTASTFGLIAAAFFFAHGVLRIQSPGTLAYIASLDRDWGLSAYLAVQMSGTQGLASAGIFALSIWAVGVSTTIWLRRSLSRSLALLGVLPALPWIMGLLGRTQALPESLWLLYIGSIFLGIPIWSAGLGVALIRVDRRKWDGGPNSS